MQMYRDPPMLFHEGRWWVPHRTLPKNRLRHVYEALEYNYSISRNYPAKTMEEWGAILKELAEEAWEEGWSYGFNEQHACRSSCHDLDYSSHASPWIPVWMYDSVGQRMSQPYRRDWCLFGLLQASCRLNVSYWESAGVWQEIRLKMRAEDLREIEEWAEPIDDEPATKRLRLMP
jgi:hypothetical protein